MKKLKKIFWSIFALMAPPLAILCYEGFSLQFLKSSIYLLICDFIFVFLIEVNGNPLLMFFVYIFPSLSSFLYLRKRISEDTPTPEIPTQPTGQPTIIIQTFQDAKIKRRHKKKVSDSEESDESSEESSPEIKKKKRTKNKAKKNKNELKRQNSLNEKFLLYSKNDSPQSPIYLTPPVNPNYFTIGSNYPNSNIPPNYSNIEAFNPHANPSMNPPPFPLNTNAYPSMFSSAPPATSVEEIDYSSDSYIESSSSTQSNNQINNQSDNPSSQSKTRKRKKSKTEEDSFNDERPEKVQKKDEN